MNHQEFNKIVEEFLDQTEKVLVRKEGEYSLDADRFSFFKRMAQIENCTPEEALEHCMSKHITSLLDMIQSGKKFTKQQYHEKLGDLVNYCILLYGLLADTGMYAEE